jgi:membrane-associated phospholipid phosphatase
VVVLTELARHPGPATWTAAMAADDWWPGHAQYPGGAAAGEDVLRRELAMLLDLMAYRDGCMAEALAQAVDVVGYFAGLAGFTAASHPETTALCHVAMQLGQFVVMHFKRHYDRPRPSELLPALMPPIDVPGHAAYPSGHATQAHLIAHLLAAVMPDPHPARALLTPLAERIAINREVLGVHYRSDSLAGRTLAAGTFAVVSEIARGGAATLDQAWADAPPAGVLAGLLAGAFREWRR